MRAAPFFLLFLPIWIKSDNTATDRREVLRAGLAVSVGAMLGSSRSASAADAAAAAEEANPLDASLLPGFKVHKVKTSGATLHTVVGGNGPPLLLIHGAPQTHLSWSVWRRSWPKSTP